VYYNIITAAREKVKKRKEKKYVSGPKSWATMRLSKVSSQETKVVIL
jgi:hypothetical protein